jgi:hypothetical protein
MVAGMTANLRAWGHGLRFGNPGARRSMVAVLALLMTLSACASPVRAPGASTGIEPEATPADRIHQQAHDALARWADAVRKSGGASITFTGELTSQIGAWEVAVGENNKLALEAGAVKAATTLPDETPSRSQVKWLDGSTVEVNVVSAAAALAAIVETAMDPCTDCTPLSITGASLATSLVETSRRPAEAPTWVFSIAGSNVRVTRVAVDESVTVVPPPWNANDPPVGPSIMSATGGADSKKLTVTFVGAVDDATKPCGADYTGEAVESELAVVVIVSERRHVEGEACRDVGAIRTADVRLASKLGDRTVLEVQQGLPVPVLAP